MADDITTSLQLDINNLENSRNNIQHIRDICNAIAHQELYCDSILHNIAMFWGRLYWWQKLLTGVILTGSLIATGIFAHITICVILAAVAFVTWTLFSCLMQNHYNAVQRTCARMASVFAPLVDLLGTVIEAIHGVGTDLRQNVDTFSEELQRMRALIEDLEQNLEHQTTLTVTLENMLKHMSTVTIHDEHLRQQFIERLQHLLQHEEASLLQIFDRISDAERQLEHVTADLVTERQRFNELFHKYDELFTRYEALHARVDPQYNADRSVDYEYYP